MGEKDESDKNTSFGFPERLADHTPGHERGEVERAKDDEGSGHDRFPAAKDQDIPRETLAARVARSRKRA